MSEEVYDLESIVDFKTSLPNGEFVCKLIDVQLGSYDGSNKDYLQATFDIVEGEFLNESFNKRYSLKIFQTKTGSTGCMGLNDFRRETGKIGATSQLKQKFTAEEFKKLYMTIFGKKKLRVMKTMEKDYKGTTNDDGSPKMWPKYNIVGIAGTGQVAAGADPLADLGF